MKKAQLHQLVLDAMLFPTTFLIVHPEGEKTCYLVCLISLKMTLLKHVQVSNSRGKTCSSSPGIPASRRAPRLHLQEREDDALSIIIKCASV